MSNKEGSNDKPSASGEKADLQSIMKSLRAKENSESSSNGGNNSDNSALVSLGNTSFGFNFDSEEGMSNNSKNDSNDDSDGNEKTDRKVPAVSSSCTTKKRGAPKKSSKGKSNGNSNLSEDIKSSISSLTNPSSQDNSSDQNDAAANAVANLESIVRSFPKSNPVESQANNDRNEERGRKRKSSSKMSEKDSSSGGYNSDDESGKMRESGNDSCGQSTGKSPRKKKRLDDKKRVERNQREKERSFRISKQITELRNLLSSGGVIVPKGTKSSVLTEAANYIRMLQQHQYRSEIDRHQLVQQMQLIGQGAHGPQAAQAIRHFAAQNGVWSLGNFGGLPPKSAMTFYQPQADQSSSAVEQSAESQDSSNVFQQNKVEHSEYRFIFNSCGFGMAIASMGGSFIDCNQLFCQLSNYSKQEVCSMTIFNLTSRQDLQRAFDKISQLISPPMDANPTQISRPQPIIIRGSMRNRDDLGMSISLVKGDDGIAKCFCITLVKNPSSPFDTSKPIPVSFDAIQRSSVAAAGSNQPIKGESDLNTTPAFTSG